MLGKWGLDILLRCQKVQIEDSWSDSGYRFRQVPVGQLELAQEALVKSTPGAFHLLQLTRRLPVPDELWRVAQSWTRVLQPECVDLVDCLTLPSRQAAGLDLDLCTDVHGAGILCIAAIGRWYRCSEFCGADLLIISGLVSRLGDGLPTFSTRTRAFAHLLHRRRSLSIRSCAGHGGQCIGRFRNN